MFHGIRLYILSLATVTTALASADATRSSTWVLALLAIAAPILPVYVGWLLTQHKLKQQDKAVKEIHVLVNKRLSDTLTRLADALVENIRLKDALGIHVPPIDRAEPAQVKADIKPEIALPGEA
jgi:hypothetical protein